MAPGPFNSDEFERHRDFIKFSVEEKILQFCRRKVGLSCQIFRFGSKSVQSGYFLSCCSGREVNKIAISNLI